MSKEEDYENELDNLDEDEFGDSFDEDDESSSLDDEDSLTSDENIDLSNSEFSGTIRLNKTDYSVGLFWNTGIDRNEKLRKNATEFSESFNNTSDLLCIFNEKTNTQIQYALGSSKDGHKKGTYSLAAHLASCILQSFPELNNCIALFELDEGYYILGIDNRNISPVSDLYYPDKKGNKEYRNKELVKKAFYDLYGKINFEDSDDIKIIAPEDFEITDSDDILIEDFLKLEKPKFKLESLSSKEAFKEKLIKYSLLVGVLLAIGFGIKEGVEYLENERRTQIQDANQEVVRKSGKQIPDMPWKNAIFAKDFISTCQNSMLIFPASIPGWGVENINCDGSFVRVLLYKNGGTVNWIEPYLVDIGYKEKFNMNISITNQSTAVITYPIIGNVNRMDEVDTLPVRKVYNHLISYFDEYGHQIGISTNSKSNDFYKENTFMFQTKYNPSEFSDILNVIPSLTITDITLKSGGDNVEYNNYLQELGFEAFESAGSSGDTADTWLWQVRGKFYERNYNNVKK